MKKYIVPKGMLHDLMSNYLNDKLGPNQSMFDSFIVLYKSSDNDEEGCIIEYDYDDGRLYIDRTFLEFFSRLFPTDEDESMQFIKDWFERRYDVKINYCQA